VKIPPIKNKFDATEGPDKDWIRWIRQDLYNVTSKDKGNGVTADRPTNGLVVGSYYFDTTLGYNIWYDGTNWVDASGSTV